MAKVRVGLIGTGSWARKVHLPALLGHPGVTVVGLWGRDPRAAREAAGTAVPVFTDADALIAQAEVVSFALAPAAQPALAARAAAAGRHVILEKPVALTTAAARSLAEDIAGSRVESAVFLSRIWDVSRAGWLDRVAGEPWDRVEWEWVSAGFLPGAPGAEGWRREAGILYDVGPHLISLLEYILGPVARITGVRQDENLRLHLDLVHESGAGATVVADLRARVPSTCESARLTRGSCTESWATRGAVDFVGAYAAMLDDLLARVRAPQSRPSRRALMSSPGAAVHVASLLSETTTPRVPDRSLGGWGLAGL